jgi:uncharacterized repeat protein (TIGR03803 family)
MPPTRLSLGFATRLIAVSAALSFAIFLALTPLAHAQNNIKILHTFTGYPNDGTQPLGTLTRGGGYLYGTTPLGGANSSGTVFKVNGSGKESVLYNFAIGSGGNTPMAGVIRDPQGNLYGTTAWGGAYGFSFGTVFEIEATGSETTLHSFGNGSDGWRSNAALIRDTAGNLYGTTAYGGANGQGSVFEITAAGQESVLYSFAGGSDGAGPNAALARDSAGNLYGTTLVGGNEVACSDGCGTVFKVTPGGEETVLYRFAGGTDGSILYSGVLFVGGKLYGTVGTGGAFNAGKVYELNSKGEETVLYSFGGVPGDGSYPDAVLFRDSLGDFYGTAQYGGTYGFGAVFKLSATGQESVLYSFTGGTDGAYPVGGVIRDSKGNLYGVTQEGGTGNNGGNGTVYELTN